jgi:SulP family sulfate permease
MAGYDSVPTTSEPKPKQSTLLACIYGLVASLMCAPVMMSFASIIFADPFFSEYSPELVKLVLFSSAVHQLCYVKWSTMPFAVGQVQDAGLIFLSSMARFVVADGRSHDDHAATTMAAALWTLGLATALLGVMLIVIGRLRLASLAQYLPVPVVGGYLAYIGFYCGQAGLAMMSGVEVTSLKDWPKLFHGSGPAKMCVGVVVASAIVLTSSIAEKRKWSRASKSLIMPFVLLATCVIFYFLLYVEGSSLNESRANGWVGALPARSSSKGSGWRNVPILRPWALYAPRNSNEVLRAVSRVAPRLIPSWLAMVCVVAFSSSLDVAAVEMELGSPLNYDSELQTAVWKSKFYGAFAIDATPARWRGDAGSSPLDGASTGAPDSLVDFHTGRRWASGTWLLVCWEASPVATSSRKPY